MRKSFFPGIRKTGGANANSSKDGKSSQLARKILQLADARKAYLLNKEPSNSLPTRILQLLCRLGTDDAIIRNG